MSQSEEQTSAERQAAFDRIVSEYEAPLLRYAVRIMNSAHAAQDVVQETFIRLFERWRDRLDPNPQVTCWLYRAVHNCAVDQIRKESRRTVFLMKHAEEQDLVCQPELPEDPKESTDDLLKRAMSVLNLRERQLVTLKVLEDKSYKEISEITGLSISNVGYILHHAVKKMSAQVRRRPDDERSDEK